MTCKTMSETGIQERVRQQGIEILYRSVRPGIRGSTFQKGDQWYIVVNRHDSPERRNFTIAHEYFEIQLNDRQDLSLDEKHHLASKMVAEFLLPDETFGASALTKNLHELKQEYPHVSYEVIARRLPYFRPVVVSILDNLQVTSRFGAPTINFPREISEIEMKVARISYETGKTVTLSEPPLEVTGYYLEEINNIVRVFVVAEVDE